MVNGNSEGGDEMNNTVTAEMLEDLIATAPTTDGNGRERTETAANGHFTHNVVHLHNRPERALADSGIEVHARSPLKKAERCTKWTA